MINKKEKVVISGNGSIELETIVKEKVQSAISKEVEELAKKYYRDITVEITVNIK
ncbi:hypothetical protein [Romboutsia ilealis]|uniref:hypothetical protein n=1 Tax=Romboutsia ilealis TaxID=1115758 RepID=UPI0026F37EDD|nr:hypothetical protein [Romboutsia ilealis]